VSSAVASDGAVDTTTVHAEVNFMEIVSDEIFAHRLENEAEMSQKTREK